MLPAAGPPIPEPVPDLLRRLDGDMETILRSPNMPLSEKVLRYNEILGGYLDKAQEYRGTTVSSARPHPIPVTTATPNAGAAPAGVGVDAAVGEDDLSGVDSVLLDMLPSRGQAKGSRLIKFIKSNIPGVKWTQRGELQVNDRVIKNSHIVDLIDAAVSPSSFRSRGTPAGWEVFGQALLDSNVPQNLLSGLAQRELKRGSRTRLFPLGDAAEAAQLSKKKRKSRPLMRSASSSSRRGTSKSDVSLSPATSLLRWSSHRKN